MILVSLDGNNIKSFIVNKNLHIKKVPILILGYVSPLRDKYDIKTTTPQTFQYIYIIYFLYLKFASLEGRVGEAFRIHPFIKTLFSALIKSSQ